MTPHLKERLRDLSRRTRQLFDSVNHVCCDDPAPVDEQLNAEWQQIREEIEEMLEAYPHLRAYREAAVALASYQVSSERRRLMGDRPGFDPT